ncbi:thiamine pyrophosphate-dependent enzyme [Alterinioella nitratireducens]|jgi:phosphonopyruvate decarboxylase|uniref:thiamine pyrophosphate-dependent enzyme n=1 Tax=Alterinioella nitratireducens TaxID=2735915 RepID=UPI000C4735F8|nr:thiamine pyrophosphate-binding protein [Nioella sp.]|tara:strand:- start:524 stop:1138 length:615 start_codon:yes stop_codon:yes gene_type:complete
MTDFLCRDAISAFATHRGTGEEAAIVVATMTSIRWINELSPGPLNISCVPLMGGASALGLGLALAQPERQVVVLDGDGSLLMQLGSLVTIAGAAPRNFTHIVFNNGVWFENLVNLSVPGTGHTDYAGLATATGFASAHCFDTLSGWSDALPALLAADGPSFVELVVTPERDALWTRDAPQPDLPEAQFTRMGDEGRAMRALLTS